VTNYKVVKEEIPRELLKYSPSPDPAMLKGVEICKGKDKAEAYTKALVKANYRNIQRIKAIRKLVK
jgi:hypothetical protein